MGGPGYAGRSTGGRSYTRVNCAFRAGVRWWLTRMRVRLGLDRRLCSTMSAFCWSRALVPSSTRRMERS